MCVPFQHQPPPPPPPTCSSGGGMVIAAFVIAIVGTCVGLAALTVSIVNAVRIGRLRKRYAASAADDDDTTSATTSTSRAKSAAESALRVGSAVFHPSIKPPYHACIFSSQRTISDANDGYSDLAEQVDNLARNQEGYLGIDSSSRNADGFGITVSYWRTDDATKEWKRRLDHVGAQMLGRERFYADYHVHVARVEREYGMVA